jgi:hypothetical protein
MVEESSGEDSTIFSTLDSISDDSPLIPPPYLMAGLPVDAPSGFWGQFMTGVTDKSATKVLNWFQKYSPMFLREMIEAQTVSSRKYSLLVSGVTTEDVMEKWVEQLLETASSAVANGSDLSKFKAQLFRPYYGYKVCCTEAKQLEVSPEFFKAITAAWPDLQGKPLDYVGQEVVMYRLTIGESYHPIGNKVYCDLTIELSPQFENMMKVKLEEARRYYREFGTYLIRPGHGVCWFFHEMHWDQVLDFVLYGYFNDTNFMQGTFHLSCWDPVLLKEGKPQSQLANVVAQSSYNKTFTAVSFTFAMRPV